MIDFIAFLKKQPEHRAFTLHAATYTSTDFLVMENNAIFESHWQLVGHTNQLQKIGDQIVAQVGNTPIIVVRNSENELTAMHNVCRHRAGPLATKGCNNNVLRCKYHGWTYDLNGILVSAPEMQSTKHFNIKGVHLPKAYLDIWQNFIFVAINKPKVPLKNYFVDIEKQILPIDLKLMSFSHRDEYIIECNWKVYMDNYLEGYHLPHVHPGLNKLLDYRNYGTKLYEWYSYQFSPLDNEENNNADVFYGEGDAHYYCVFPNLMLNILPGRLQINLIIPVSQRKTRIIFDYYYSGIGSKQTQKLMSNDRDFSDQVQQEDISICEQVQVGLNSGSYQSGPLCMKRESGVLHFQNLVRRSLREIYGGSFA